MTTDDLQATFELPALPAPVFEMACPLAPLPLWWDNSSYTTYQTFMSEDEDDPTIESLVQDAAWLAGYLGSEAVTQHARRQARAEDNANGVWF